MLNHVEVTVLKKMHKGRALVTYILQATDLILLRTISGDMRTFQAVDVEALHHLVDCVVFPAAGHRPHPNEMSGSDLDGDKYFVTWLDKLIPKRRNEEAMDFTAPKKKTIEGKVEVSDMIEFISDYIKNDQLGIIANAHLVHADCDEKGRNKQLAPLRKA